MAPILRVERLDVAYARSSSPTLHDVTLEIEVGQAAGVVGESGSGKSTLAWTVMNLLPPGASVTGGSVQFEGRDVLGLPAAEQSFLRGQAIAMVFQDPFTTLNPCLTIGRQLTEVLLERRLCEPGAARQEALRLLDEVHLPRAAELLSAYPHQLSGGMKQRVVIASALACSPRLLILDEPTTALDVTVEARILRLLAELQSTRGLSMLFISHNLGIVEQVCSTVTVMQAGQVVETGAAQQVLRKPRHEYTQKLLAALPRLAVWPGMAIQESGTAQDGTSSLPPRPDATAEARGVSLSFGHAGRGGMFRFFRPKSVSVRALDDVSLTLRRSEIVGLVGESGSGKSTLGRCLIGLYAPQKGQVIVDGEDVSSRSKRFDRRVQMVFQNPDSSLNPRHRVGEIVGRPLRLLGVSRKDVRSRVDELLTLVRLPGEYARRYPHELSGGQKQRIGIARALALEPEILICDEITSALDVSVQATILDLVKDLRDRLRVSILFISHDLAVISQICDRIVVMKAGRVVEEGITERLITQPAEPYTRELLSSIPRFISETSA